MYDLNVEVNPKVAKTGIFPEGPLNLFVVGENSNNGLFLYNSIQF
jgi:hypothetical protein